MSAVETRRPPPAETEVSGEHRGPPSYALQAVASSVCTVLGELLGSSVTGKLAAGILGAWLGAFLTAPGRRHGRRIVAVALLLLLLDAGRALAAGVRRQKPARPPTSGSSALPASWTAVAAATAAGFVLGTGVTAAGHAVAGNGVRLTAAHQQQAASPPRQPPTAPQQTQTLQQQTSTTGRHRPNASRDKPSGGPASKDVTVPSVTGQSQAAAVRALRGAGLRPEVSSQSSRSVPSGDAIGTDPAAGAKVPRASRVSLLVSISTGVSQVAVPDVTGQTASAAVARLKEAGLIATVSSEPVCAPSFEVSCSIDRQEPLAGANVPSGTNVALHEGPAQPK